MTQEKQSQVVEKLLQNPVVLQRAINNRSFYDFFIYFWPMISNEIIVDNWHIKYLCKELQQIAFRVSAKLPKEHDLIINIPPGTTKTTIVMIMFPVWCWTIDYRLRFITSSYSATLSMESAEMSRDLIRNESFKEMYPDLNIKADKDTKSNYKIIKTDYGNRKKTILKQFTGGNRYTTSVGGTLTGFHGHILLVDDPLNPAEASSDLTLKSTNNWIDQVLSTRKVDKSVSTLVVVMQRIHQNDPSGHLLSKKKANIKHICLPGELNEYGQYLKPKEVEKFYKNNLLDPIRLSPEVLEDMRKDLGQYGYAGQVGQNPTPPGGGMFKVDMFNIIHSMPLEHDIDKIYRYWDKAATTDGGAFTVGVKIARTKEGRFIIMDAKRGQWSSEKREIIIRKTAEGDGKRVMVWIEQEPGSGGKESAESTVRNLAGYIVDKDLPKGDKSFRADPFSVQVNYGNVSLLYGDWNHDFIEEFRNFPFGKYKDQVDAASACFAKLTTKKKVNVW